MKPIYFNLKSMKIKRKNEKENPVEVYVIDTIHEQTIYNTTRKYAVDKDTFKKYFPNWNIKTGSKSR